MLNRWPNVLFASSLVRSVLASKIYFLSIDFEKIIICTHAYQEQIRTVYAVSKGSSGSFCGRSTSISRRPSIHLLDSFAATYIRTPSCSIDRPLGLSTLIEQRLMSASGHVHKNGVGKQAIEIQLGEKQVDWVDSMAKKHNLPDSSKTTRLNSSSFFQFLVIQICYIWCTDGS